MWTVKSEGWPLSPEHESAIPLCHFTDHVEHLHHRPTDMLCTPPFNLLSGPVLRDTARLSQRYPPIACYGVFGVSTWPIGCDTPSPFSERFPLGEHAKWRCDTPLKRGISAILARYPMKTRQMGAIPPSAILSRKGIARYGGVSRTGPLSFRNITNATNASRPIWCLHFAFLERTNTTSMCIKLPTSSEASE